jgi:hypothetical protein
MTGTVSNMRARLRSIVTLPPRFDAAAEWLALVKRTIARFARGNIAAQNGRVLTPEEQAREHDRARAISDKWRKRYKTGSG